MNPNDDDDDDSGNDLYEMDLNLFVPTPPTTEDSMREHFPRLDSTSRTEDNDTRYGDNCSRGSFTSSFSNNTDSSHNNMRSPLIKSRNLVPRNIQKGQNESDGKKGDKTIMTSISSNISSSSSRSNSNINGNNNNDDDNYLTTVKVITKRNGSTGYKLNIGNSKHNNSIVVPPIAYLNWDKPQKVIVKRCQTRIPDSARNLRYDEKRNGGWIKYINRQSNHSPRNRSMKDKKYYNEDNNNNQNSVNFSHNPSKINQSNLSFIQSSTMKPSSLNILINDSYYNDKKDIIAPIDTSSILAFSVQDMYAIAHEGINITKLVMQDWATSLTTEAKYFSSYFVFGQIKWREAVTTTETLGRPNPFLTRAAFSIFASAAEEFGPYRMILTFLLDKLSECCLANYHHVNTPLPSSFFDGLTHQEYLHYLERSIEELESKFVEIEEWEEEARKEKIRTNVMFDSIVNIWSKGILGLSMLVWRKFHKLMKKNLKRVSIIMTFDHANKKLDNLWWFFNRWHSHHTQYIHYKHSTNAILMWKLYRKLLDENKKLNEHVHTLKVEVQSLEKESMKAKEKIYKASLRLEQVMSDWTAMKQREKDWLQYGMMWHDMTIESCYFLMEHVYMNQLKQASIDGIEMVAPMSGNIYVDTIHPILRTAGFVGAIKQNYRSYPICSRVLRLKNAEMWVLDQPSSIGSNKIVDLVLAIPSYPPILDTTEGIELQEALLNIKKHLVDCLSYPEIEAKTSTPKSPINNNMSNKSKKENKGNDVTDLWKKISGFEKEYNGTLTKAGIIIDECEENWKSLKSSARNLEYITWLDLSNSIAKFKGHITLKEEEKDDEEGNEETKANAEEELLAKRRIDEQRFAHIQRFRLNKIIKDRLKKLKIEVEANVVEEDADMVIEYLREHVYDIKDTFRLYAGTDGGISSGEFIKFCKDVKIINKKILKATDVERLFIKINLNSDDTDGVDKEMDPDEFLEGIVHVGSMRFMTETTLYSCIQKLVEEHIIPYADKVDLETFKRVIKDPEVVKLVRSYRGWLRKTFRKAADEDSSQQSSNASSSMSVKEFVIFAKSMKLMRGRLSNGDLESLFARVQQNDGSDDEEEEEEMMYAEFEEGVLALCCYEYPNPHTPYIARLKEYLMRLKSGTIGKKVDEVFKVKRKKIKR